MNKKNVLLISIDCLGTDKLFNNKVRHPFIDSLIASGAFCSKMFSSTSSTTPSIASIHTGLFPQQHGILSTYGHKLKKNVITLAQILKKEGYRTSASVGGPLNPGTKLNNGFDTYNFHPAETNFSFYRYNLNFKNNKKNERKIYKEYLDLVNNAQSPWFHWVHFLDLHNRWRVNRKKRDSGLSDYENAIEHFDQKLQALVSQIDLNETLLILVADHGHYVSSIDGNIEGVNYTEAHGFHVYDLLTNVPFIIVNKELIKSGTTVDTQVSTVDILPSILDLLSIDSSSKFSGRSFAQALSVSNKNQEYQTRPVYLQACGAILRKKGLPFLHAIRWGDWKYIKTQEDSDFQEELFNISVDPVEHQNVFNEYPQKVDELSDIMNELLKRMN